MSNNLKKITSFYKTYYKDLDIRTIRSHYFINFLEFDILIRFNFKVSKEQLKVILEALQN